MTNRLKEARKARGLTQAEVAAAAGVTTRAYQYYESGQVPNAIVALRLQDVLGTPIQRLFGSSDSPNK